MAPPKRRSIIAKEERTARILESRKKYSTLSLASARQTVGAVGRTSLVPRPSSISSRPATITARSVTQSTSSSFVSAGRRPATTTAVPKMVVPKPAPDFAPDANSLKMIQSGRSIPNSVFANNRPSVSGRFRPSIAANQPRPSLLPLGINIFDANESERIQVREFMDNFCSTTGAAEDENQASRASTPGRSKGLFAGLPLTRNGTVCSSGSRIPERPRAIRFMENDVIQEQRESVEAEEIEEATGSSREIRSVRRNPMPDSDYVPTSILSTKKKLRGKVSFSSTDMAESSSNGSANPLPKTPMARRVVGRINMMAMDEEDDDEREVQTREQTKKETDVDDVLSFARSLIKAATNKFSDEELQKMRKIPHLFKAYIDRVDASAALNETVSDNSHLPLLQGGMRIVKTPKAIKEFRKQPLRVFSEIVSDVVNDVAEESDDDGSDDERPMTKAAIAARGKRMSAAKYRRQSVSGTSEGSSQPSIKKGLFLHEERPVKKSLFKRRSARLSSIHQKASEDD